MGPAGTRGSGGRPQGVRFGLLRAIRRILQRTGLNDRRSRSPGPYVDHDALVPLIIRSRDCVRTNGTLSNKEPQRRPASRTPFWILLMWRNGSVPTRTILCTSKTCNLIDRPHRMRCTRGVARAHHARVAAFFWNAGSAHGSQPLRLKRDSLRFGRPNRWNVFVVLITVPEGNFLVIRTRDPQLADSLT